jgi:hypothetical protein
MVIQNILGSNSCVVCQDSISDPVCKSCYIKQLKVLLNDFKIHPTAREIILRKIKNKFFTSPLDDTGETKCILCQRENVTMCRYCFSVILRDTLRELGFTKDSIEEFGFNTIY